MMRELYIFGCTITNTRPIITKRPNLLRTVSEDKYLKSSEMALTTLFISEFNTFLRKKYYWIVKSGCLIPERIAKMCLNTYFAIG